MSTLAVTGGTGFIGKSLSEFLQVSEYGVSLRRLVRDPLKLSMVGDFLGDLTNRTDIEGFVKGASTLIHLASVNDARSGNRDIAFDLERNLIATTQLFEIYCQKNPGGHIIFVSSGGALYDPSLSLTPRTEDDKLGPISSYGIQKLAIEHYLRLFHSIYGVSSTILRVSNPYGVLLPLGRAQGLIGVAYSCAIRGGELPLLGSSETVRDYLHLDDLNDAFIHVLRAKKQQGVRTYNIGQGTGHTTREVIALIERVTGKTINKVVKPGAYAEPAWNVLNIEKAEKELGWKPRLTLVEGLEKMCKTIG